MPVRKKVVEREYWNREDTNVNFEAGTISMRSICFCNVTLECGHKVTLRGGRTFKTATCPECKE